MKNESPPSSYPFPSRGKGRGLHPRRGGRTDSRELGAAARGVGVGGCKRIEKGGWPLPPRRGQTKRGQPV